MPAARSGARLGPVLLIETFMKTFEIRAELAVTNALRQLGTPLGQPVDVQCVEKLWDAYGIRATDFKPAIDRMSGSGRLRLLRDGDRHAIALTDAGAAWALAQPAWLEYALLVPRRVRAKDNARAAHRRSASASTRIGDGKPSASGDLTRVFH